MDRAPIVRSLSLAPRLPQVAGLLLIVALGCGGESHPRMAEFRERVLLEEEPSPTITIEEAQQRVDSGESIALLGKMGVPKLARWHEPDAATFAVSEGTPGSEYNIGPDHDPSTCPFCKTRWKDEDSMAFVTLTDSEGAVIPVNALALLNVSEGDLVVVRGQPTRDESGFLHIQCEGVFVRP